MNKKETQKVMAPIKLTCHWRQQLLMMGGGRVSVSMALTQFYENIKASVPEG